MKRHAPVGHRGLESRLRVLPKMTPERHTVATNRELHLV